MSSADAVAPPAASARRCESPAAMHPAWLPAAHQAAAIAVAAAGVLQQSVQLCRLLRQYWVRQDWLQPLEPMRQLVQRCAFVGPASAGVIARHPAS